MTAEDYAKEVTQSAGIHKGHPDEEVVHNAIYAVMGNKYHTVTGVGLIRYRRDIERKLYDANDRLARRVEPHLSSVLKNK